MRPTASHAAVSSVGKHTARESEAPNAVRMGKSVWRAPTPDFGPGTARFPGLYLYIEAFVSALSLSEARNHELTPAWRADRFFAVPEQIRPDLGEIFRADREAAKLPSCQGASRQAN